MNAHQDEGLLPFPGTDAGAAEEEKNRLVSLIHQTIRDGNFRELPGLLLQRAQNYNTHSSGGRELLWEPNQVGYTAVQYAASHFLPFEWWDWILEQAETEDFHCIIDHIIHPLHEQTPASRFIQQRNAIGENVVNVFLQTYLDPMPWQPTPVKHRSKLLRSSIHTVIRKSSSSSTITTTSLSQSNRSHNLIQELHRAIRDISSPNALSPLGSTNTTNLLQYSSSTSRILGFWIRLERLCRACRPAERKNISQRCSIREILRFLARSGSCPELLAQLVLLLDRTSQSQADNSVWSDNDDSGNLYEVLRAWAHSPSDWIECDGMLPLLLEAVECQDHAAVVRPDFTDILEIALSSGKPFVKVREIFGPYTIHMDARMIVAVVEALKWKRSAPAIEALARKHASGEKRLAGLWNLLSPAGRHHRLVAAKEEVELEATRALYEIIRGFPETLKSHILQV